MAARTLYYHNNKQTDKYHYPLHENQPRQERNLHINNKEKKEPE